jgi:hypothetical protein
MQFGEFLRKTRASGKQYFSIEDVMKETRKIQGCRS